MNYSELLQLAKGWGNFKFYRGIIWRLRYFNDIQKVSMAITKNRLIIEQFSQMGDDLEGYFTKLVAGVNND